MPFLDRRPDGRRAIGSDSQRTHTEAVARIAIQMDLHVQRRDDLVSLLRKIVERDRQAETMAVERQIAVVLAKRSPRLGQMAFDRVKHQAIGFVNHCLLRT